MKCKNCGAEIPENSRYCDICGERNMSVVRREQKLVRASKRRHRMRQTRKIARKGCLIVLAVAIGAFLLLMAVGLITFQIDQKKIEKRIAQQDLTGWETIITPEEYEKLQIGMTYEEAVKIVGGEAKLTDEWSYSYTYSWPGEFYTEDFKSRVEIDFSRQESGKDVVNDITARDFIRADEIKRTHKIMDESDYEKIDTVVVSKKQYESLHEGMNYEQVCEVLGGPGMLNSDYYSTYYSGTHSYETYVWKAKRGDYYTYVYVDFEDGIIKHLYSRGADYID